MKPKRNKWLYALLVIAGLTILSFFISSLILIFSGNDFVVLDGNTALIELTGTITAENAGFLFEDVASSEDIANLIKKANDDDRIKAIIFRINSPGGSPVASEEIAYEIKKTNNTTVAWIRETGASGAYWIASSADYIVASRMSVTGSVGVIASYLGFSGFLEEHNVSYERLVAGELKDMGSPFKDLTENERLLLEKTISLMHQYFIEEVAENRNLSKSAISKISAAGIYLGSEAKELGLVDELGGRDEVISYIESRIGEEVKIVEYKRGKGLLSSLSEAANEKFFYVGKGIGNSFFTKAKLADSLSIST
ncbi:signal peptide peptidase SppA [Candidatus Woesearchaeota archaeon]|nr:signal peptide peptidase SppA [Candidatus Woesearchaeota archaeon]